MNAYSVAVAIVIATILLCGRAVASDVNIALGKSVVFDPTSNDSGCTDTGDAVQLTDGLFAGPGFWIDKSAVGWVRDSPVHIIIDLGTVQAISGVSFSTAARANAGVLWPASLIVQVSDDGKNYHYICNMTLRDQSVPPALEPTEKEFRHVYRVDNLRTHGRYVVVSAVSKCSYLFCDEIEIYAGTEEDIKTPLPQPAYPDYRSQVETSVYRTAISERLMQDIRILRDTINNSKLSQNYKDKLAGKLQGFTAEIDSLPKDFPPDFKAILPVNPLEARIFVVNGELLARQQYPKLTIWKKHRYDRLDIFETPQRSEASISIAALKNEYRADSFLLTNASAKPLKLTLTRVGLPNSIEISAVPWTDTSTRVPVASALPELIFTDNKASITVPAGMTTKVWVGIDTANVASGKYKGSIAVSGVDVTTKVPVSLVVSKVAMKKPRLHLGVWDHTNGNGNRGMTVANIPSAIKLMVSHYTDCPWTEVGGLPMDLDLTEESFATFDQWIKRWPNAARYMVFINSPASFHGHAMATDEFNASVGAWARAVEEHLVSIKVDPRKLTLLLVDEPGTEEQDRRVVAWIKAIRASGVGISFFQDPIWENPSSSPCQEAMTLPEIICPNLVIYHNAGEAQWRYYESIRKMGRELWFYLCSGPVRNFDPSKYYRLTAWHAFAAKAKGIGFWSFGDIGGRQSSWNEYVNNMPAYAPAFVDPDNVTDSVHWNAVREGVQDYEYLAMLADAASATKNKDLREQADHLLNSQLEKIVSDKSTDYNWKSRNLHSGLDSFRLKIIAMLEKMQ